MTSLWRAAAWAAFIAVASVRPGADRLDRWLVSICWGIPSEWNAVADMAIRTGVVDSSIGGRPAPWRQASVLPVDGHRIAVVTVSDMQRSRATFLTERYEVIGAFERTTADPALVTDETRGYKPLTHIWPLVEQDDRVLTLVSLAPLRSEPPTMGVFAYLGVGPRDTELLFVCVMSWAPGPTHGELARIDVNGDGFGDLVLYPDGRRDQAPVATFQWDAATRAFTAAITDQSKPLMASWSTTREDRVTIGPNESIDDAVAAVAAGLRVSPTPAAGPGGA
jgi:hypothetical protein